MNKKRSPVVEIVGSAGVGKSTLVKILCQQHQKIRAGVQINKISQIPLWVSNTVFLMPSFLSEYRHSRWFTWKENRSMAYLQAWLQALKQQPTNDDLITVFDHGPIFRLVLLKEFGPPITKSKIYQQWWNNLFTEWAATLDMVVWLDAPDSILLERILKRDCQHVVKNKSEEEAYDFLRRYRLAYQQAIHNLTEYYGIKLLTFNTNEEAPEQIASKIRSNLLQKIITSKSDR